MQIIMAAFLENVALWMINHAGKDLSDWIVVLPNKRSCVFFRYYLGQLSQSPLWAPEISDISSFLKNAGKSIVADNYTSLALLYLKYQELMEKSGFQAESFDRFYPWGTMILSDFDEIDKNLVDATTIFRYLGEWKKTESFDDAFTKEQMEIIRKFWEHVDSSKLSSEKEKFLQTWQLLPELYQNFKISLQKEGLISEGSLYRNYAEQIQKQPVPDNKKIAFAGFHFLNKAEKRIFLEYKKSENASFFWDTHDFFLNRNNFPPYQSIKENMELFPAPHNFINTANENIGDCKIEISGLPVSSSQCKYIVHKLKEKQGNAINHTGIILANEHILFPLLKSIPEEIEELNITMGYPMYASSLAGFINKIIDLQSNKKNSLFLNKDILHILNDAFFDSEKCSDIRTVFEKPYPFYSDGKSIADVSSLGAKIFQDSDQYRNPFAYFIELVRHLSVQDEIQVQEAELSFIHDFLSELLLLEDVIVSRNIQIQDRTAFKLLKEIIQQSKNPFEGEPLGSTQIMGVLETRCLDFTRLFILNMNEGCWPKSKREGSFIPYNLRKAYGLKTFDQDDHIYAYYFYRLLHRSKEVCILYTSANDPNTGEKSRYLNQIKYDLKIPHEEKTISHIITLPKSNEISIVKSKEIMEIMEKKYIRDKEKLSPSAINAYIDCPLKFYWKHICKITEDQSFKTDIDPALFGDLMHRILQKMYLDKVQGNSIDEPLLKSLADKRNSYIKQVFTEVLHHNEQKDTQGQLHLIEKVLQKYIAQVLQRDIEYAPFQILGLEDRSFYSSLEIQSRKVQIGGIIDRIDLKNNVLRIIDYKSGADNNQIHSIESLFDIGHVNRNKAALQILIYCNTLSSYSEFRNYQIQGGIYNVRNMFDKDFDSRIQIKNGNRYEPMESIDNYRDSIQQNLEHILGAVFDEKVPFFQTEEKKNCQYCSYHKICKKH
jgi:CRISPR/Cas system-associated exonuclease Cas4 (RecB family)